MLTQDQIDHYEAFGYLVIRGLLSQDEMDELRAASLSVMRELRGSDDYQTDVEPVRTAVAGAPSGDARPDRR